MLKIHQTFITQFIVLFIGTLSITSLISYMALESIIIKNSKTELKNAIVLIQTSLDSIENLDDYASTIKRKTSLRVTMIDDDGEILCESDSEKKNMDNHSKRYEVIQAMSEGSSEVIRESNTIKDELLYVAKKVIYNKKEIVIRLSVSIDKVMESFYTLWQILLIIFTLIIAISLYISKIMSKKILFDIEQITIYLDEISNKNYRAIIKVENFYEFLQISLLLKNLVKKLNNRDKLKRKHTAKLRLINRQRNDILSAISHEFKNPIASIKGYAQTIEDDRDISPKIQTKFLGKIVSNADKVSLLLDRLALSVKLENSDIKVKKITFDIKELAEEVVSNLSSKYKNRDIELQAKSIAIDADKTMIEIVMINLIDNALKYSQKRVNVVINKSSFMVIDEGIGIKEKELSMITNKFYRVEKNSWDNSMGIGLAMVKYILKAHNKELIIESKHQKGSKFGFML